MISELIGQIEQKLKTNYFEGLLESPLPNIQKEKEEIEKLIFLANRIEEKSNRNNEFGQAIAYHKAFANFFLYVSQEKEIIFFNDELQFSDGMKEDEKIKLRAHYNELIVDVGQLLADINIDVKTFDLFPIVEGDFSDPFNLYHYRNRIKPKELESALELSCKKNITQIEDYNRKLSVVESIAKHLPKYLGAENIDKRDTVIVNVGKRDIYNGAIGYKGYKLENSFEVINSKKKYSYYRKADTKEVKGFYADVFIITNKHIISLSIGENGLIDRTEHLLRDIKKVSLAGDEVLEIFFHGHFDAATIVLDSYSDSLNLQRKLTALREAKQEFQRPDNYKKG